METIIKIGTDGFDDSKETPEQDNRIDSSWKEEANKLIQDAIDFLRNNAQDRSAIEATDHLTMAQDSLNFEPPEDEEVEKMTKTKKNDYVDRLTEDEEKE